MLSEGEGDEDRTERSALDRGVLWRPSASGADMEGGIIEALRVVGGMVQVSGRAGVLAGWQACWNCELARETQMRRCTMLVLFTLDRLVEGRL